MIVCNENTDQIYVTNIWLKIIVFVVLNHWLIAIQDFAISFQLNGKNQQIIKIKLQATLQIHGSVILAF